MKELISTLIKNMKYNSRRRRKKNTFQQENSRTKMISVSIWKKRKKTEKRFRKYTSSELPGLKLIYEF